MDRGKFLWCRKLIALRKLFALALCFSFILTPLEVAFAQDGGTGTTPTDTTSIDTSSGSSSSPTPPANDFSIPGVDATQPSADANTAPDTTANNQASAPASDATAETALSKPGPAPLSAMAGFGGSGEPTIADPTVFTGQNAAPRVDGASGALTQTIPIDTPPGRNGLQPSLALTYNSQDGEDSIVGYGWSVSIPYIQLLNKTGSQNLYNVPHFTSSIDGELATSSNGTTTQTFVARIDDGHFNSYSLTNNVWTMYDKNGTRYTFGASDTPSKMHPRVRQKSINGCSTRSATPTTTTCGSRTQRTADKYIRHRSSTREMAEPTGRLRSRLSRKPVPIRTKIISQV